MFILSLVKTKLVKESLLLNGNFELGEKPIFWYHKLRLIVLWEFSVVLYPLSQVDKLLLVISSSDKLRHSNHDIRKGL